MLRRLIESRLATAKESDDGSQVLLLNQLQKTYLNLIEMGMKDDDPDDFSDSRVETTFPVFALDEDDMCIHIKGTPISLTTLEFKFIKFLYQNIGRIVHYDAVKQKLWPNKDMNSNVLEQIVYRLRHKIKSESGVSSFINTVRGKGYFLNLTKL